MPLHIRPEYPMTTKNPFFCLRDYKPPQAAMRLPMSDIIKIRGNSTKSLGQLLHGLGKPFSPGETVGIKIHWGERGNAGFLPPRYTRKIVRWLHESGVEPFVFDTTVLYSGGRRTAADSLETAAQHGFTEGYLGGSGKGTGVNTRHGRH